MPEYTFIQFNLLREASDQVSRMFEQFHFSGEQGIYSLYNPA